MTDTIAALVAAHAGDDRRALLFEGETWTWAEAVDAAATRAAVLGSLLSPSAPPHVGVLLENVPEYVFLLAGGALAGACLVGVNPTRRGAELERDVRHTDCQVLITEKRHLALLDGLSLEARVLVVDSDEWASMVSSAPTALPPSLPDPSALWVLLFTSGSTGAPKAVRGTQGRYAQLGRAMPFAEDDVLYCSMPLFHGNALASCFVPALVTGATLALRRRFSASSLLDDLRAVGATYFNTVGRALSYVLATPPLPSDRDHRVKFALGPESSPADVKAFKARFGIPVIAGGYSSSEGAMTIVPVGRARPGALGRAADGQDIAVVDQSTGAELPAARFDPGSGALVNPEECIGELVRRDTQIRFEGYYNNPEAEAERRRNGWYWSGDLAYRDEDGVFYFAGRTADWLRVDAENFAAAPIERILGRWPGVAGVAVYGVPDPVTGDQVMAALELRPGAAFSPEEFAAFLAEQADLGTKWAPRFVRIVDALPSTGADKLDKKPLRSAAWVTSDPVWWRPAREAGYRLLDAADADALAAAFAEHGRSALLPG